MVKPIQTGGSGGGGGFNPPTGGSSGSGTGAINLGLLTSSGGLTGLTGILMTPCIFNGKTFINTYDPSNFNCEENCEYDFRQEANYDKIPGEGRTASFNRIVLRYRELGVASFNINITVFSKVLDDFITTAIPIKIPILPFTKMTKQRKMNFPDKKLHTVILHPSKTISGEKPQITLTSFANAGPYSVTKIVLCGDADEISEI